MKIEAQAPIAAKIPLILANHGCERMDNYYWMNERENPEVIAYLEAENAYTEKVMGGTKDLQAQIFQEIKGRIVEEDSSVPYKIQDYWYYVRYEMGKEYPLYCRKKGDLAAAEEILLDGNVEAEGHNFFQVMGMVISPQQNLMAYAVDTVGRRIATIYFKDLDNQCLLPDSIANVTGNMTWAMDNQTLFYVRQDEQTLRWDKVYTHRLGDTSDDALMYEEKDETFYVKVGKSKSKKYIFIYSDSTVSTEIRYAPADAPTDFRVFQARERDFEYAIDHSEKGFFILTNWNAKNFRLMKCGIENTEKTHWEEVVAHKEDTLLEDFELFKDFLVMSERNNGLNQIHIYDLQKNEDYYLPMNDAAYMAYITSNFDYDIKTLRYSYESMTTPNSTYIFDMETKTQTLLKQEEVRGGFSSDFYASERLFATADDGTKIPISVVYRKDCRKNSPQPLLLYAYGSYGISMDAYFSVSRLSLLDRGFIFAIAHIRGGSEMGRMWYEDGKLLKKKNTFTDFINCAEFLIQEKYTDAQHLFAMGGSAGGMLMGGIVNMRPDLWKGVVAQVPFVDVVTTMLDDSIPLTTGEYDEWGNPNEQEYFEYMLSYSPYDNVAARDYPNLLVMSGLHDSQVQYFEPTKWVAKLRDLKTNDTVLLLKTNMEAGHGGASGRFEGIKETAFEYAFLLFLLGETA